MNKKLIFRIAQIAAFVAAGIFAFITALFFSVGDKLYWLFLVLGVLALSGGLFLQTFIVKEDAANYKADDNNEEQPQEEKKPVKWFKRPAVLVAMISFTGIILCGLTGHIFETSGNTVTVTDGTLTKKECDIYNKGHGLNGTEYTITDPTVSVSYTVYKPNKASESNKYPVVFVVPGFTRTKATMSQYAIELSRRGSVVFTIDPGSQGATTYGGYEYDEATGQYVLDEKGNKIQNSYSVARSGMGYLLTYVYNNEEKFNYINRDQIGLVGHSAGGGDACKLAADFAGNTYEESIVKALYISGYIKTSAANVFYKLRCNAALSYAKYDEGSFRYQDENQAYEVIALRFINEVNSKTGGANGYFPEFEQDFDYGDFDLGTYRIIHHENINHCFEMYDGISIANTTNFFRRSLKLNTSLKDSSQTWFGKELSNGLALSFGFALIISVIGVVTSYVPFMKSLEVEANAKLEKEAEFAVKYSNDPIIRKKAKAPRKDKGIGRRLLFWLPMVLTAIIACLDYIPLARLSMDLFPDAAGNIYTYYFPERMMNAVFLWAVINGSIGIAIWVLTTVCENLFFLFTKQKEKMDWSKFAGLKVKPLNLLKSLLFSIVLFFAFYGLIQLSYVLFHQDFRFMLISASPLTPRMLVTWLIYIAGFYVFYFSNSIRVNLGIAREGFKEWQVLLISALANSLGLVFIIIINYYVYFQTGTVFYGYYSATDSNEMWLYVNMVFPLIVMMAILPIFNRLAYKKMGNVYSGALLWCMIFIMMSLSASISFIPM